MSKELEYWEGIRYSPDVTQYGPKALEHGLSLDKLVSDGIWHATEGVINPDKDAVREAVVKYIIRALQECAIKKLATKPAQTKAGRFRLWLARLIAGDLL